MTHAKSSPEAAETNQAPAEAGGQEAPAYTKPS
jgi:hypothetical protein